jgi:hypothetical protein
LPEDTSLEIRLNADRTTFGQQFLDGGVAPLTLPGKPFRGDGLRRPEELL